MNFKISLAFSFLFCLSIMNAQNEPIPCGTSETKVEWLKKYQSNQIAYSKTEDTLFVPLSIHIVGSDEGVGFFSVESLLNAFCVLNEDYAASRIRFFIEGDLHYISNSAYAMHNFGVGYEMMQNNNIPNSINCYIVADPAGACGYSYYDTGIALSKNCLGISDHTWAHEIGHNLSLPHTFYGWEGITHENSEVAPNYVDGELVEKVDGSNCANAADGFCDTPPDYLSRRWACSNDGLSTAIQQDPNGETFRSDGTLFMSYSTTSENCRSRFSEEQTEAMRNNLYGPREHYLYNQTPVPHMLDVDLELISPIENIVVGDPAEGIELTWEAIPNATHYIIQVNPFPSFSSVLNTLITTNPYAVVEGLDAERKYFWRVRPYSNYSSCIPFSTKGRFETGTTTTGLDELEWSSSFEMYPNPLSVATSLNVEYTLPESTSLYLDILDLTGKRVYTQNIEGAKGKNKHQITLSPLPKGLYLLNLIGNEGQVTRKIIIR